MFSIPKEVDVVNICSVCSKESHRNDDEFSLLLGLIKPYACMYCDACGLRWLSPRPTARVYNIIYSNDYYFSGDCAVEDYERILIRRNVKFKKRLQWVSKFFPQGEKIELLDIGAATGDFVNLAQQQGYSAEGLELSSDARRKALEKYSLQLFGNTLTDFAKQGKKYKIIHMNHVFEHFLDPNETLKVCFSMLTNDGILVLEVPHQFYNDLDRLRRILFFWKQHEFSPYSLHHTYFYSPTNLSALLNKHGFSIMSLKTSNAANTPFWYKNIKDLILLIFLFLSDRLHNGGNIIEIVAKKKSS